VHVSQVASRGLSMVLLAAPCWLAAGQSPSTSPHSVRLDVDRHVVDVVSRNVKSIPRFEEKIEVVDRSQFALDDLLRGLDLACGATPLGPPPKSELNAYRGATIPVHVDFLPGVKLLVAQLQRRRHPAPRWFVYGVRQGETVRFILREGEISEAVRGETPGTTWVELARFHDRGSARDALRRLDRGFATPGRQTHGDPLPPWVATTCRPPAFR
jgi:hypothetical protein